jgi:phosphoglycolate phosphatase
MKMLLFDVDLTLVATGGAGVRALDRAFEERLEISDAMASITPHGKTDPSIVREVCHRNRIINPIDIESITVDILNMYLTYLEEEVSRSEGYRVLPGILELLKAIHPLETVQLGLATGNLESGARIKLERGGLNAFFRFGGYGSDAEDRVELVKRAAREGSGASGRVVASEDTFVIGDTPRDIDAGRKAGFRTVGVATGSYSLEELEKAGADLAIDDFRAGRDQFFRSTRIV